MTDYSNAHAYDSDVDFYESQDPKGAAYDRWVENGEHQETALAQIEQFVLYHASDRLKALAASIIIYSAASGESFGGDADNAVNEALDFLDGDFCRAAERIAQLVSNGDIDIAPVVEQAAEFERSVLIPLGNMFWREIENSKLLRDEFDRMIKQDEEDRAVSAWEDANGF